MHARGSTRNGLGVEVFDLLVRVWVMSIPIEAPLCRTGNLWGVIFASSKLSGSIWVITSFFLADALEIYRGALCGSAFETGPSYYIYLGV